MLLLWSSAQISVQAIIFPFYKKYFLADILSLENGKLLEELYSHHK